jgi:hypothetical protein
LRCEKTSSVKRANSVGEELEDAGEEVKHRLEIAER